MPRKGTGRSWRFLGLEDVKNLEARNIPYGHQRLLEIGRALATSPKLLLLDEPAAGMNSQEKKELSTPSVKSVTPIIWPSCWLSMIWNWSWASLRTLRSSTSAAPIACGTAEEIQSNNDVIEAYLGRSDDE